MKMLRSSFHAGTGIVVLVATLGHSLIGLAFDRTLSLADFCRNVGTSTLLAFPVVAMLTALFRVAVNADGIFGFSF